MTVTPAEAARDLRKHASAIKSALTTQSQALGKTLAVYELDEVNDDTTELHVIVHVFKSVSSGTERGTSSDTGLYRLYLRYVGTTVSEVQWADWVAGLALDDRELTLQTATGAQQTVRVTRDESGFLAAEQQDDGNAYVSANQWTYAV